jgi:hypothetical protein
MPWHVSKSDPRKLYDGRHETVCVCQNAEQAALIVESVNQHGYRADPVSGAEFSKSAIPKPDLAALASEAHGEKPEDCGFAVTRRR